MKETAHNEGAAVMEIEIIEVIRLNATIPLKLAYACAHGALAVHAARHKDRFHAWTYGLVAAIGVALLACTGR